MSDGLVHGGSGNVPSVADLRPVVQGAKVGADRRWSYRLFRRVSVYITWLLLHTTVTPNQVTVASLVTAAIGLVLIAFGSPWVALFGYLLLLMYHLLDRVDGEIARFREIFSLRGIYLDNAGHYLTGAGIFLATTYRYAPAAAEPQIVWLLGTIGGLAAMMSRVEKHAPFQLFSQYVLERPQLVEGTSRTSGTLTRAATRADRAADSGKHRRSLLVTLRDGSLSLTSFPAVAAAFIIGLVVTMAMGTSTGAIVVLVGAALLQTMAYIALEVVNLSQNLDAEEWRLLDMVRRLHDGTPDGDHD